MKAIFIGNGSSVKDYEAGSIIDEFDIVVRFNRGFLEGIDKYKKFVGSKTNVVVVHEGFIFPYDDIDINKPIKEWNWKEKMKDTDKIQIAIGDKPDICVEDVHQASVLSEDIGISKSNFLYMWTWSKCNLSLGYHKCFKGKGHVVPRAIAKSLREPFDFGYAWPSTGLVGMTYNANLLTQEYEDSIELYSYGFDGADEKYEHYHYYTHSDDRTTKEMVREDRKDHKISTERECLALIKKQFNIKELKDEL